ncbi:MAG: flippase-like domain-containing protein [Dehalococcoidia bacterium]|nr:flippase-like domain-containing protein [Dehalococcoidia bacterium]
MHASTTANGSRDRGHHRGLQRLVPWLVTSIIFALIFRRVPIAHVLDALRGIDASSYLAIMLPYSLVYLLIDTFCLTRVVNWFNARIAYRDVLPIRATTYLLTLLNSPLGQGSIALYLNRREGIPLLEVASSVLFMMFAELYQLVFFSSLGAALAPRRIEGFFWVYVALYAYLAAHLAFFRFAGDRLAAHTAAGMLRSFRLAHLRHYLLLVLFKAPNFLMATVVYYFALRCFGIHLPYLELLVFLPVIFLSAALPIGVAHLGAPQYFWLHFFGDQAPAANLLAFSLTAHVTFMVMNAMLGVPFLPRAIRELSPPARSGARSLPRRSPP